MSNVVPERVAQAIPARPGRNLATARMVLATLLIAGGVVWLAGGGGTAAVIVAVAGLLSLLWAISEERADARHAELLRVLIATRR